MLSFEKFNLNHINLEELANVLSHELKNLFHQCRVSVEECPDLTKPPFNLAAPGLCGNNLIADIGGVGNLVPLPNRKKVYSFEQVAEIVQNIGTDLFMIGAAAGPFHKIGHNCELMPNVMLRKENDRFKIITDNTYYAEITQDGGYNLAKTSHGEFGLLCNLFVSEGKQGKVLKIEAQKRIGKDNFPDMIRNILKKKFPHSPISLGGVFLIEKGKVNLHIMPDFSKDPLMSNEAVDKWLRFFEMSSPLVCLTTMHSIDPNLDLRIEHTHCFSDHNHGGHYHYDTTPEDVRYVAYLNPAQAIFRIDRPTT